MVGNLLIYFIPKPLFADRRETKSDFFNVTLTGYPIVPGSFELYYSRQIKDHLFLQDAIGIPDIASRSDSPENILLYTFELILPDKRIWWSLIADITTGANCLPSGTFNIENINGKFWDSDRLPETNFVLIDGYAGESGSGGSE